MLISSALSARVWTDASGRTVEAEFLELLEDRVRIKRIQDNRVFSLPLDQLSQRDRAWLAEKRNAAEDHAGADGAVQFEGLDWPRRTRLPDDYDVEVVEEDNKLGVYLYRTPNFEFRSEVKLARKVVREFGKIFEGTLAAMEAFPLDWKIDRKDAHYQARLFEDTASYLKAGGLPNSAGLYLPSKREIYVPISSLGLRQVSSTYTFGASGDRSTLIHEITHQVHHDWLGSLFPWFVEGLAVYMESVPEDDGEFHFDDQDLFAYFRRFSPSGEITMVDPVRLISLSHAEWTANFSRNPAALLTYYQSAFLLTHYFLHLDGNEDGARIWSYISRIERGEAEISARAVLFGTRSPAEFVEELRRAYDREGMDLVFVE